MSKKHLSNVVWLLVAGSAFGLGWMLKRVPESPGLSSDDLAETVGKARTAAPESALEDGPGATQAGAIDDASARTQLVVTQSRRPLSSAEIEELGKAFKTELDPIERRLAFARLLEGMTVENALEIRAQIEHLSAESSEFREFHFAWGKIGGVDAVMHGAGTDQPDMAATLAGWANADPQAALQWLETLDMENDPGFDGLLKDRGIPADRLRSHFLDGMVRGLASTDPDLASKFVFNLAAEGNAQAEGMLGIVTANVLRASGPIEAAQWAENLPEGALRSTAMGKVASVYARDDPAAAAAWAESFVSDEKGGHIVHGITNQWAKQDGAAAVAWLESLNEVPGRSGAYYSAFEGWAGKDPSAASEYLTAMPESSERDHAISGLVSRHRWEDPVASIVWADAISSEKARLEALTRAGQAWTRLDAPAAAEWAASSGLPEKLQQAIVSPPRGRK